MGDSFVRIIPPEAPSGEFLPPGHRILAEPSSSFNDLAGSAGETLEEVTLTASEIRAATDQVGALFSKLDREFFTAENRDNLATMLAELRSSSEHLHDASKKLNPLLEKTATTLTGISEVTDAAKTTLKGVDQSVIEFSSTLSSINPVVADFDRSIKQLTATLGTANELLNLIENGDGIAPLLLKDSALRRDLESFLDKLDRNGLLLYPREGGLLRDSPPGPSILPPPAGGEKRSFPGLKKQP